MMSSMAFSISSAFACAAIGMSPRLAAIESASHRASSAFSRVVCMLILWSPIPAAIIAALGVSGNENSVVS